MEHGLIMGFDVALMLFGSLEDWKIALVDGGKVMIDCCVLSQKW